MGPEEAIHSVAVGIGGGATVEWAVTAISSGIVGVAAGSILAGVLHLKPGAKH